MMKLCMLSGEFTTGRLATLNLSLGVMTAPTAADHGLFVSGRNVVLMSIEEYETLLALAPAAPPPADNNKTLHLKGLEQIDENARDCWL